MEYYSTIKNEILPFATIQMNLESILFSKISQRKTNNLQITYIRNLKIKRTNVYNKLETDPQLQKTN